MRPFAPRLLLESASQGVTFHCVVEWIGFPAYQSEKQFWGLGASTWGPGDGYMCYDVAYSNQEVLCRRVGRCKQKIFVNINAEDIAWLS